MRKSSAQITAHYAPEELMGRMVMGVLNFPPKQVGPFMSEFLLVGFEDESGRGGFGGSGAGGAVGGEVVLKWRGGGELGESRRGKNLTFPAGRG